jgi:antitoxin (DNA-binding transcriptional repressor) of toxin-antitoxin stability system
LPKNIGVAEVKKHFSEVMSQISQVGEQFIIEKKGKPMAAMVGLKDLEMIERSVKKGKKNGLLAAIGAWEDFEELDKVIKDIYLKRKRSGDRKEGI